MSWIHEAREKSRRAIEAEIEAKAQADADKANYDSETVSDEMLVEFTESFLPPVRSVLEDLVDAGFVVQTTEYGYLTLGEVRGSNNAEIRRRYSLSRVESSDKEYSRDQFNMAFGVNWKVNFSDDLRDNSLYISVLPRADQGTHYAGVEYRVVSHGMNYSQVIEDSQEETLALMESNLQACIGEWIARHRK